MSDIILTTTKFKVYEYMKNWCEFCNFDRIYTDSLWADIVTDEKLYNELVYYLENHTFLDKFKIGGYSLSDLFVFQMSKYNLISDLGKNPPECNKERMVVKSFKMMTQMKDDPETYLKRLEEGKGNDL